METKQLSIEQAQRQIDELRAHIKALEISKNPIEYVKEFISRIGLSFEKVYDENIDISLDYDGMVNIQLPLPSAHVSWTLAVFRWALQFMENVESENQIKWAYIKHSQENGKTVLIRCKVEL